MALHTFSASNQTDFVTKLLAAAVGGGWVIESDLATSKVLKIPGGGYVALLLDGVNVELQAFRSYDPGRAIADQIGALKTPSGSYKLPRVPLHNQAFQCWISVSGRRLTGVCRISNTYHSFYLGLLLPFANTDSYPFPAFVGGSGDAELWSSTGSGAGAFPWFGGTERPCRVCLPGGGWQAAVSNTDSLETLPTYSRDSAYIWPFDGGVAGLGKTLAGDHVLYEALVISGAPATGEGTDDGLWCGYLDGVFAVSNVGASAESIITIGADSYMLVPNIFRGSQYFAMRLS